MDVDLNKKTKEWGTEYDSTADFAHIPMVVGAGQPVEAFTIGLDPKGEMSFAWDTRLGRIGLTPVPTQ